MAQRQYIKEIFPVVGTDLNNDDGTSRQKLLKKFSLTGVDEVTFNRGPIREDNTQLVEVMVQGQKLGELKDED